MSILCYNKIKGQFNVLQRVWFAQLDAKNNCGDTAKGGMPT
jgi:hypothetical protein